MDADLLMFIYLQQFDVTFENNQNDGFCQLVTHNIPSPHLKRKHFKMAKDGPFPCTTNLTPPPPRSPFPSLWPLPVWDCEMILQLGCFSSPLSDRLHCPLQCSCPVAILKMGTWKGSIYAWVNSLNSIITHSEVKLCGMWVEIYKNTMSHLILPIVVILLSQQGEVANSHLPTETRGSETLPWVFEASHCFTIHLKLCL